MKSTLRARRPRAPRPARAPAVPLIRTAEELFCLPDDGFRYELVAGELIQRTPSGAQHGDFSSFMAHRLRAFVDPRGLGRVSGAETGFILRRDPDTVRAPDAAFIRKERVPPGGPPKTFWPFAPDLAVEVVSPNDPASPLLRKVRDYLRAGTRLVWVIDPDVRTVTVYKSPRVARVLEIGDVLTGEPVLPGFRLPLAELFAS
jgi:Uma2 family endonuclease